MLGPSHVLLLPASEAEVVEAGKVPGSKRMTTLPCKVIILEQGNPNWPAEVWALLNGAQWAQGVQGMIRTCIKGKIPTGQICSTSLPSFSCCHQCCRSYSRRSPWMFNLGRTLTGGQLHPGRPEWKYQNTSSSLCTQNCKPGPRSAPRCPRAPLQGRSW